MTCEDHGISAHVANKVGINCKKQGANCRMSNVGEAELKYFCSKSSLFFSVVSLNLPTLRLHTRQRFDEIYMRIVQMMMSLSVHTVTCLLLHCSSCFCACFLRSCNPLYRNFCLFYYSVLIPESVRQPKCLKFCYSPSQLTWPRA